MGIIIIKDEKFLLGKRKGSHGDGSWCFTGGHLESGESWEGCAARETEEEVGIKIKNIRFAAATNDIFEKEGKHYITIFMLADYDSGKVELKEPEKFEKWDWFARDNLPSPLFLSIRNLLKQEFNPFEK